MSVKAQALVWDLECPKQCGDITFKSSHKYVLIAYADHADHNGKNIYPAVGTIARKTGLDERTVQRLTNDLESIGLLIDDGQGPKGTNRWKLPISEGGDKLTPLSFCQGDKDSDSLGDIPSGDIPSGDKLTPELKEPKPLINKDSKDRLIKVIANYGPSVFGNNMTGWWNMRRRLEDEKVQLFGELSGNTQKIVISGLSAVIGQFTEAEIWTERYSKSFANLGLELEFQA